MATKMFGPVRKTVDLAFAMDCTGSMASYIENARQNIRTIAEEIVSKEKVDLQFALVEYRDHPPQEETFVTNVLDFTDNLSIMKSRLNECAAVGGGDTPEAIADALYAVLKLSWRPGAVKICVLISDAPPHGLQSSGDEFAEGCPCNLDPMVTARELATKQIAVYTVGCEPSISPYKDWFMAISYLTSGQYVPLASASVLSQVIVAGTMEEISLSNMMSDVTLEVERLVRQSGGNITDDELSRQIYDKLKDTKTKTVKSSVRAIEPVTEKAERLAEQFSMAGVRRLFTLSTPSSMPDLRTFADEVYEATDTTLTMEQATRLVSKSRSVVKWSPPK